MPEEFLDIVSENNELTGESASRSRVHTEGLWHRTVQIFVYRRNNGTVEFLVHLRSPFKDNNPNMWDTRFGGHIKSGTTMEEAVRAELKEEIGLEADTFLDGEWRQADYFPNREFAKAYYFEYLGELSDLKFNDGEVQEVKWMSLDEIKKSITEGQAKWSSSLAGFVKISDCLLEKI